MKITAIRATSRASVKVGDSFYTVEYCEERSIDPDDNVEEERKKLWDTCNGEVDNQIEDTQRQYRQRKAHRLHKRLDETVHQRQSQSENRNSDIPTISNGVQSRHKPDSYRRRDRNPKPTHDKVHDNSFPFTFLQ